MLSRCSSHAARRQGWQRAHGWKAGQQEMWRCTVEIACGQEPKRAVTASALSLEGRSLCASYQGSFLEEEALRHHQALTVCPWPYAEPHGWCGPPQGRLAEDGVLQTHVPAPAKGRPRDIQILHANHLPGCGPRCGATVWDCLSPSTPGPWPRGCNSPLLLQANTLTSVCPSGPHPCCGTRDVRTGRASWC